MLHHITKKFVGLLAFLVATCIPLLGAGNAGADEVNSHLVEVSFDPPSIALGESSILTAVIRRQGGATENLSYTLTLPTDPESGGYLTTSVLPTYSGCGTTPPLSVELVGSTAVRLTGLSLGTSGCTVAITVNASAAGTYNFSANSSNFNSNFPVSSNAAGTTLTVTGVPETTITAGPSALTNAMSATFSFTGTPPANSEIAIEIAFFECKVDTGSFAECTSPHSVSVLDGAHTFQVRAWDTAGNVDPSPASYAWTVDTTAPDTTITAGPAAVTNATTATFEFSGTDNGSSEGLLFKCKLDAGTFTACASPQAISGLAIGAHTFQVQAVDAAGNVDPSAASRTWTIEAPMPAIGLSPGSLDFGSQTIDTASGIQSVSVFNAGAATLSVTAIIATGDFNFEGCATPLSLTPQPASGSTCTLAVKFVPTAVGTRSGTISIFSNAPGSPHSIALTGIGTTALVPGIAVTPASASFGSIIAGTRVVEIFALSNTGNAALSITGISVAGPQFEQTNTCPPSLAAGGACNISVAYAPAAAGTHSSELRITSNAVPSPLVIPLAGSALPVPAPELLLSATSVAFAPQIALSTSAPKTVTLTNSGTAPLQISSITSSGDFGYSGCGFPSTIAAGDSCVFSITFKPVALGPETGSIEVASNAPGSPHSIALSGTGVAFAPPEISLAPSALAFGTLRLGTQASAPMRITSTGASTLEISRISTTGAFFSQSNNCPATLAIGAFCDITVTYDPKALGAHSGQLRIESNAVPNPFNAALSGTAITVPPPFLVVDRVVDFGQQVTGDTARVVMQIANSGGDPLVITAMQLVGTPEFGIEGGCGTIAAEGRCTFTLTFTPSAVQAFAGRLDIVSNHSGGVVRVELVGEGTPRPRPDLQLSVDGLGFGNQVVGTVSDIRTVTLSSVGNRPVQLLGFDVGPDFVISTTQCPVVLEPRESCQVGVAFKPLVPGPRSGQLTIIGDAEGGSDFVSLTGVGCRFFTMGAARNPARLCSP